MTIGLPLAAQWKRLWAAGIIPLANQASCRWLFRLGDPSDNTAVETTAVQPLIAGEVCSAPTLSGPILPAGTTTGAADINVGDLNGDGRPDLVTSMGSANVVAVYFANASGGYGAATLYPAGTQPIDAVLADFNADNKLDLAIEGLTDASVLFGNGTGGFGAPTTITFAPEIVSDVRTGDFNGDGKPDLAIATILSGQPTGGKLRILLNDGAGGFTAGPAIALNANSGRLAIGDFNGDGKADVAASFSSVSAVADHVLVLLGNGNGGFAATIDVPTGQNATDATVAALGDLNGDGFADLGVVENSGTTRQLVLLFGDGTGHFAPQVLSNTAGIFRVASADMNGDGKLDLVATGTSFLGVLLGDGAGHFPNLTFFSAPTALELRLADLNGDGRTDVALAMGRAGAGGAEVLLNACGRASTDLALTVSDSPDPVQEGGALTYTATVTNNGPLAATNVSFTATVPTTATVNLVTPATGTCATPNAGVISCNLGTLQSGAAASVTVQVTVGNGGTLTTTAGVGSDQADPTPTNNSVTITTTVTAVGRALLVTNTNDSGAGSLRQAILDSNADSGDVDRISFNILGAGLHTIAPSTALPAMTQPAIIDGTTQPGFAGTPIIELSGANIATTVAGLAVNSPSGGAIKGLVVNRFRGAGITVSGPGITISGNYVGTTTSGTAAAGNFYGISLLDSSNNVIGGATAGTGNLISGNTSVGIVVTRSGGSGSNNNQIVGNLIGTDVTGTLPVPNATGVDIFDSSNNRIGGNDRSGAQRRVRQHAERRDDRRQCHGHARPGELRRDHGRRRSDPRERRRGHLDRQPRRHDRRHDVGCRQRDLGQQRRRDRCGYSELERPRPGEHDRTERGTDRGARESEQRCFHPVVNLGNDDWRHGGRRGQRHRRQPARRHQRRRHEHHDSGQHDQHQSGRNGELVTRERRNQPGVNGIEYTDRRQRHWRAQRDHRDDREPHGKRGVRRRHEQPDRGELHRRQRRRGGERRQRRRRRRLRRGRAEQLRRQLHHRHRQRDCRQLVQRRVGQRHQQLGPVQSHRHECGRDRGDPEWHWRCVRRRDCDAGARGTLVGFINNAGNLISGNNAYGLFVDGDQTQVQGNTIGNNLANAVGMIVGTNAHSLLLGGEDTGTPNLISGNTGIGVSILAGSPGGYVVEGNTIVGNGSHGISIGSPNNRIGGVIQFMENVISGNGGSGILISGPTATGNIVQRNYIGTNSNGTVANPNRGVQSGIFIQGASNNTVGGTTAEAANVVSGNTQHAITICCDSSASGNLILGNFVGTRRDGITPLGNGGIGIDIVSATNTTVGGPGAARNVIANNQTGVQIRTGAAGNVLRNNAIVANTTGVNINDGAVNNTIGGISAGDGNVLQGNGKALYVLNATSVGNAILGNSISGTLIGIDLANDGVTPTDPGDVDTGPNNLQNFPVLTSATVAGLTLTCTGDIEQQGKYRIPPRVLLERRVRPEPATAMARPSSERFR